MSNFGARVNWHSSTSSSARWRRTSFCCCFGLTVFFARLKSSSSLRTSLSSLAASSFSFVASLATYFQFIKQNKTDFTIFRLGQIFFQLFVLLREELSAFAVCLRLAFRLVQLVARSLKFFLQLVDFLFEHGDSRFEETLSTFGRYSLVNSYLISV